MTHPEDLLADYVSGSLSAPELATVEAHLSTCSRCTADLALARAARASLRALPEVPAPTGVASRAIEAARETDGRGRAPYRWLGVAAAAAVVALAVVALQHRGPAPSEAAPVAAAIGGADTSHAGGSGPSVQLTVEQTNYTQTTLDSLASAALSKAGSAAGASPIQSAAAVASPGERPGTSAELQTALACVGNAVPRDGGATPFRLLLAQFNGKPAYLAFYYRGPQDAAPTSVIVWIVDSDTCTASGLSSAGT
jgi:predicted anti-sigma-YlaC factor YlaD